jgi:hypothetical protein
MQICKHLYMKHIQQCPRWADRPYLPPLVNAPGVLNNSASSLSEKASELSGFFRCVAGVLYCRIFLVSIHKLPFEEESLFSFCSKILTFSLARVFF